MLSNRNAIIANDFTGSSSDFIIGSLIAKFTHKACELFKFHWSLWQCLMGLMHYKGFQVAFPNVSSIKRVWQDSKNAFTLLLVERMFSCCISECWDAHWAFATAATYCRLVMVIALQTAFQFSRRCDRLKHGTCFCILISKNFWGGCHTAGIHY